MAGKLISIQEAAKLSDRSTQTIRRLIKTNKVKCKKTRTPQGFNYNVYIDSLAKYYNIDISGYNNSTASVKKQNTVFSLGIKPDPTRTNKKTPTITDELIPIEMNDAVEGITIEETINEVNSIYDSNENIIPDSIKVTDTITEDKKTIANDKQTTEKEHDTDIKVEVIDETNEKKSENKVNEKSTKKKNIEVLQFASLMQQMLNQHKEDKERLFVIIEQFQERTVILEERLKKLEAPKKRWWQLW